jgi:hypothetical protein
VAVFVKPASRAGFRLLMVAVGRSVGQSRPLEPPPASRARPVAGVDTTRASPWEPVSKRGWRGDGQVPAKGEPQWPLRDGSGAVTTGSRRGVGARFR